VNRRISSELNSIVAGGPLKRSFYERPTIEVARDLLGKVLVNEGPVAGRIAEVEAYVAEYEGQIDRAAHSARGITERTRVIFGPAGHAYVYFIYGMHECLNVVTEPAGQPGCVLIRAVEPLAGIETMRARRGGAKDLAGGPGKLTQAFGITRDRHYGADLTRGPLAIYEPRDPAIREIEATPRIGIRECADWPLRFVIKR
jgi:DNA-3-methyladenine glycosylase